MANKKDLKSYVRYDGTGRVIPGGNILQRFKPKGGGQWSQIRSYECCDPGCPPVEYEKDYIFNDVVVDEAGMTVIVSTAPGVEIQIDILNCDTGNPIGDPQTVPAGTEGFIVYFPITLVDLGCNWTVRRICSPGFESTWTATLLPPPIA